MTRRLAFYCSTSFLLGFRAIAEASQADRTDDHHADVNSRGDHVMGFSHEQAAHHFRLYENGGAIEIQANDKTDVSTRDQIRMHLSHIAQMFAEGNFRAPMLIHDRMPPGLPTLQRLKRKITYQYSDTERGGRILITTKDAEALKALHEFLRFQIADHETGDYGGESKQSPDRNLGG